MNKLALMAFTILAVCANSQANETKKNVDFYISGFEMTSPQKTTSGQMTGVGSGTVQMIYQGDPWERTQAQGNKTNKKTLDKKVSAAPVSAEENTDGLRKTLESFQKAITGLCVSHLELNLAFNVSAKAWMVVTGEVAGSVKVILKNPDEKCPKS